MKKNTFIFDVESTSLFGQPFAVGAIVFDENHKVIDFLSLKAKQGEPLCNSWVKENVLPKLKNCDSCETFSELYNRFFEFMMKHRDTCHFWSDVCFPVESNFLTLVAREDLSTREFLMPYPLYDVASIVPVHYERFRPGNNYHKLHQHDPYYDCLTSYKALTEHVDVQAYYKLMQQ